MRTAADRFAVQYLFLSDFYRRRFSIEAFTSEVEALPSLAAPFFRGQKIFASAG
jgi:hypothetical protein